MEKTFAKLPDAIASTLVNRAALTEALFERPESLSALLPYEEYLPEEQVFLLKDGSLGAVFRVELVAHEPMTEKEILKVIASTKTWFSLPENCALQLHFDAAFYSILDRSLDEFEERYPNANPVSKMLFQQ